VLLDGRHAKLLGHPGRERAGGLHHLHAAALGAFLAYHGGLAVVAVVQRLPVWNLGSSVALGLLSAVYCTALHPEMAHPLEGGATGPLHVPESPHRPHLQGAHTQGHL
jgi:hypothetical protein